MTSHPDLTDLSSALLRAAGGDPLPADHARIAVATFEHLLTGEPAPVADIARAADVSDEAAEQFLSSSRGVYRDEAGDVIGFWGVSVVEMPPHRLVTDGPPVWFWCAWDPVIVAPIVGRPLTLETRDPVTGDPVRFTATPDGVRDVSPDNATLSFLRPEGEWDADVITSFCHYVHGFESEDTARSWTAEHDGTFVLSLEDSVELARDGFVVRFGDVARSAG